MTVDAPSGASVEYDPWLGGPSTWINAGRLNILSGSSLFLSDGNLTFTNTGTTIIDGEMTLDGPGSNTGALQGSGRLSLLQPAAFTNAGSVEPGGDGPGALTVSGDLSIPAGATLAIGIGGPESGTSHDRLDVEGAVTLGGELAVSLLDGFEPELGQSFEVLTYSSRTGHLRHPQRPRPRRHSLTRTDLLADFPSPHRRQPTCERKSLHQRDSARPARRRHRE